MTSKPKKAKRRKARPRRGEVIELGASVEDDLLELEEEGEAGARWNPLIGVQFKGNQRRSTKMAG